MKVYSYNKITKEYNGIETAQESPLEKGVYLYPTIAKICVQKLLCMFYCLCLF